jgi:hypothetical protein
VSTSDLRGATGAGVRVALIDSGVNARHSHVGWVAGGVALSLDDRGTVRLGDDYSDRLGHGTALAGILRAIAPEVELHAVKIFAERLVTSVMVLEAALLWAAAEGMRIVNLSLGSPNPQHRERLSRAVDRLRASNVLLIASSPPGRSDMLPACLPGVIAVAGDDRCSWGEHRYVRGDCVPFRASPVPRPLPSPVQARNFRGHSFASAHLSAFLALLLERNPGFTFDDVVRCLRRSRSPYISS